MNEKKFGQGNPTIQIHESELSGQKFFHWEIFDGFGREFSLSAYHTDRTSCEREAAEILEYYQSEGQI
jgi:hypothetical protein